MLKFKSSSSKDSSKFENLKTSNAPAIAWISTDDLHVNLNQEKSSRFFKFRFRNKRNSKKTADLNGGESINGFQLLKNAFSGILPRSMGDGLDQISFGDEMRKLRKKSKSSIEVNEGYYEMKDNVSVSRPNIEYTPCMKVRSF